jgi:shikimate kinase
MLAGELGYAWADTDDLVVAKTGMEIPEIFTRYGEAHFRELEAEVMRDLSAENGYVIATGGGSILREENIDLLHRNGRVYFVDRPLEQLIPTMDRPLANSEEKVRRIYRERYERYCSVADVVVSSKGDAGKVAAKIKALHFHGRGRD